MNKIIEDQLNKLKVCKVPPYDYTTMELHISRQTPVKECLLEENHCYLLKLENYIINPPANFTLHTNWNKGIIPKHECVKAVVSKIMGKMIFINSVGYDLKNNLDTDDVWDGWVPYKSIKVIKEL